LVFCGFTKLKEFDMPTRNAHAAWEGGLKDGKGNFKVGSGTCGGTYSFGTRFESEPGTNPEELIAAAHAACYSMALSAALEGEGHKPKRVSTTAKVTVEKVPDGFKITKIQLECEATVPGLGDDAFQKTAAAAKTGCPVSKALAATPIELKAKLVG
jgi:osmotically inducible protein OsmC